MANDLDQNPVSSYSVSGLHTVLDFSHNVLSSFPPNVRVSRHLIVTVTDRTASRWAGSNGRRATLPLIVTGVTPRYPEKYLSVTTLTVTWNLPLT